MLPLQPGSVRERYAVLAVGALGLLVARWGVVGDWPFFELAGRVLTGPAPLDLYRRHPEIQIGPLALFVALPLTKLGAPTVGLVLAKVLGFGSGLACIRGAELVAIDRRGTVSPRRTLLAGLLFLLLWSFVVSAGHLDDVLAITGVIFALVAISRDRSVLAGVLFGLAVASKPWAVMAVPMLLGLPPGRRLRALAAAGLVVVLLWAPFVIAAPGTVSALASFRIPLSGSSGPGLLFGLPAVGYPGWVRPLQFGVGIAVSALVARRGAWWAVPAVAFGVRLILDPGISTYYAGGLGAGALVVDLVTATSLPMLSLAITAGAALPTYLQLAMLQLNEITQAVRFAGQAAVLRLGTALAVLLLVALTREEHDPGRSRDQSRTGGPIGR